MHINDEGSFERVWFFTFAVQRLHGVAAAVSAALGGAAAPPAYAEALAAARRLGALHAAFLAQPADGRILDCLADTRQVLEQFAGALELLGDYPNAHAEAAALRREARRCEALRLGLGMDGAT